MVAQEMETTLDYMGKINQPTTEFIVEYIHTL
jgi:hypothetical protein